MEVESCMADASTVAEPEAVTFHKPFAHAHFMLSVIILLENYSNSRAEELQRHWTKFSRLAGDTEKTPCLSKAPKPSTLAAVMRRIRTFFNMRMVT